LFSAAHAAAEVKIGVAIPLTGRVSWLGEQTERAVELAVAELNGSGGAL